MSCFDLFRAQVTLVDVGAAGGVHDRWNLLGDKLRVIGFEPDVREFERLPKNANQVWLNTALYADDRVHHLHLTRYQTNTSLLEPNRRVIEALCYRVEDFDILKTVPLKCERLDDVLERERLVVDALKLDTQGTELYILQGAARSLEQDIFAIETEVEFVRLYEKQPLFTDVDQYLRAKGFGLIDYGNIAFMKGGHSVGVGGAKGQMVSADALYFKRLDQIAGFLMPNDLDRLERIIMACLVYGYSDYAIEICWEAKSLKLFPADVLDRYITRLSQVKHYSLYLPDFPGKKHLAKVAYVAYSLLARPQNRTQINWLGNQIKAYRW